MVKPRGAIGIPLWLLVAGVALLLVGAAKLTPGLVMGHSILPAHVTAPGQSTVPADLAAQAPSAAQQSNESVETTTSTVTQLDTSRQPATSTQPQPQSAISVRACPRTTKMGIACAKASP